MAGDQERDEICGEVRTFLAGESHGFLSPREAELLARHLAECGGCRRVREEHRAVWDLIGKAPLSASRTSDEQFLAGVRKRIRKGTVLRWAATLAAAATLTIAAGLLWSGGTAVDEQAVIDNLDVLQALEVGLPADPEADAAAIGRELLSMISEQEPTAKEKGAEFEGGEEIMLDEPAIEDLEALLDHTLKG
jgi:predicted anti-sigma-YlaC factor YlaD